MEPVTHAVLDSAAKAVELALGLVGAMAFFLGLMKVGEDAGLLAVVSRAAHPVLRRLFPGIPPGHPAMSAMVLNLASTMLGLGNAATPFGIKAMEELDRLNGRKGTATDSMVLFLAINASGLALLPTGVVAIRAAAGSQDPAGIMVTTWVASGSATLVAVTAALLLSRLPRYRASCPPELPTPTPAPPDGSAPDARRAASAPWISLLAVLYMLAFAAAAVQYVVHEGATSGSFRAVASFWIIPALVAGMVLYGWWRGVTVYTSLVEGAREGFQVALRIIPYLVAVLVAVGVFRASGALDLFVRVVDPVTRLVGMPAEALPMAILRPLSGSGAYAVMAETMTAHGPDSFIGYLVSTFQGSTETTFYVLAVYFGAIGVRRTRHALPACLLGDLAGLLAALAIVHLMFG